MRKFSFDTHLFSYPHPPCRPCPQHVEVSRPGQGSNLHQSSALSHIGTKAGSLTHWATRALLSVDFLTVAVLTIVRCEVIALCRFDLHFSNNQQRRASFHVPFSLRVSSLAVNFVYCSCILQPCSTHLVGF